jgi:transcriptional regulator with XRE-family HTH domain
MSAEGTLSAWAQRLTELRRARNWAEADLAAELKKLRPDLPPVKSLTHMIRADWESGRHQPGPRYRLLLAAAFDVDEHELFNPAPKTPAGQMAALTAITLANLGEPRTARRWWRTAARSADQSGDQSLASLVRGRHAVFSLYESRPTLSIIATADEAIEVGHNVPCAGVVSGYAAKAQAFAQLGQYGEAVDTMNDLMAVFECLPDDVSGDRSSQWGWSAQRLHHVASHVYSFAGDVVRADAAHDSALSFYPAENYQGRSHIELHRATCLIRAGEVDEGARHAVRILEGLPVERRGDGLLRSAAMTALGMVPPVATDRPAVRDAREVLALTSGEQ